MSDPRARLEELRKRKGLLSVEKCEAEREVEKLNRRVRDGGHLPREEYQSICRKQSELKQRIQAIQGQLGYLKAEISIASDLVSQLNKAEWGSFQKGLAAVGVPASRAAAPEDVLSRIRDLRDKYAAFAEDGTRVNSMRLMAATFAKELTALVRKS